MNMENIPRQTNNNNKGFSESQEIRDQFSMLDHWTSHFLINSRLGNYNREELAKSIETINGLKGKVNDPDRVAKLEALLDKLNSIDFSEDPDPDLLDEIQTLLEAALR